jgi:uncharacterized membrane protein (UPF0182 family)
MRVPTDLPPARPRSAHRGRVLLIVGLVALFLLITSLRGLAGFWTDYLWFESLGLADVFSGLFRTQLYLVVGFSLLFAVLLFVNLTIADRLAPKFRPTGPDELLIARYQEVMGRRAGLLRAAVSLLLGVMFGASAGAEWNSWILFTHRQSFGIDDPEFGRDIGFYVFELPFYSFVVEWLFVSLILIVVITAVTHYLNGGIRLQSSFHRVTPQVKAHLSVLLAFAAGIKAIDYWLQRFELLFSQRGAIDGAGYTDLQAQLPALELLILISLSACVLFIVNIRRRGWTLPAVAAGLWIFAALIAGTAYPAIVQRFVVEPEESAREERYIERNIEATRAALNLDDAHVETRPFEYDDTVTAEDLQAYESTLRNLRILDPAIVGPTFARTQAGRGFYRFTDLDVDRYPITNADGEEEMTEVIIAARELNLDGIQQPSWEAQHAAYTHGYGLVMAPSNTVTEGQGEPDFLVRDLPVVTEEGVPITIAKPQIYIGEDLEGYALVGTNRAEINYVNERGDEITDEPYDGAGGVAASGDGFAGFVRRAAFALRFGEIDPLVSSFVTSDSRAIYVRDVRERVQKVAPFLDFDSDPYPVVVDDRIQYVIDGYATTNLYPYAQEASTNQLGVDAGLRHSFNYVRNSVKGVVDAYDGTVTLYVIDPDDPITRAYREAFPDLFADASEMPDEVRDHLRYPDELFKVQTTMWGRYHITDPAVWYNETEAWEVAQDPGNSVPSGTGELTASSTPPVTDAEGNEIISREDRIVPYFQQMQLPGEESDSFLSFRPFVRASRRDDNKLLSAFMVAKSDDLDQYGRLIVYEIDEAVNGPALVAAQINADPVVARETTLLNQQGSRAVYGNMLLIPIEDSLLYVRPLYAISAGDTQVPQLRYVVLSLGNKVVMAPTVPGALAKLYENEDGVPFNADAADAIAAIARIFAESPPPIDEPPEDDVPPDETTSTVDELLAEAEELFAEADAILEDFSDLSDLADYEEKIQEARDKVTEALTLLESADVGGEATADTTEPDGDGSTTTTEADEPRASTTAGAPTRRAVGQPGRFASMEAMTSGASGSVVGAKRATISPSVPTRNFSKFHRMSPEWPSASLAWVRVSYRG